MFCCLRNCFKKHEHAYNIVTSQSLQGLTLPQNTRFYSSLPWLIRTPWAVSYHKLMAKIFNHSDKLFKHFAEIFKLSFKLLVFSWTLPRVLKQILGWEFCRIEFLKICSVKSTIYSLKYNLFVIYILPITVEAIP